VTLLGLKLPKVDELQVLERIIIGPNLKMIPVVMLTSSREKQDLARSYRRPCQKLQLWDERVRGQAGGLPRFCRNRQKAWALLGGPQSTASRERRAGALTILRH
jgi:CheY-like chemotaxis protein